MPVVGGQHRERHADLVVERARRQRPSARRSRAPAAIRSLVLVLPTGAGDADDRESASRSSTARGEPRQTRRPGPATTTAGTPSGRAASTAAAPAPTAAAAFVPVDVLALDRDEQRARLGEPGVDDHRSGHRRVGSAVVAARPPVAEAISARVSGIIAPPRRRRAQHDPVVERVHHPGDLLALLVALARDDHDVAGAGRPTALSMAALRSGTTSTVAAAPERAAPALSADRIACGSSERGLSLVSTATSAAARGDLAHHRPLVRVAVAAGAEDQQHASGSVRQAARRGEQPLERVRCVRVVDEGEELLARRPPAPSGRARRRSRPRPSRRHRPPRPPRRAPRRRARRWRR